MLGKKGERVVEAAGFVVRDADGVVRLRLGREPEFGCYGVFLHDEGGKDRAMLAMLPDGSPKFSCFDKKTGRERIAVGLLDNLSACSITLTDPDGTIRLAASVHMMGIADITLCAKDGKPRLQLSQHLGLSRVSLYDQNGTPRGEMSLDESTLETTDVDDSGEWVRAKVEDRERARIRLFDSTEEMTFDVPGMPK